MTILGFKAEYSVNKGEQEKLEKRGFIRWPVSVGTFHVGLRLEESTSMVTIIKEANKMCNDLNMEMKDIQILISED